ncbi:tRNA(Ile)-lysidine ligase [Enterobacter cloacae]|uniref:tRNA(Ile)-lysidine ligase n=1 Tax=Enterobacter cloacae TaxID=550 RepID=A0A377M7R0_ENTCL|nr:tRNA(Ile)-lysidine ligase [Enterobacter cloacae]
MPALFGHFLCVILYDPTRYCASRFTVPQLLVGFSGGLDSTVLLHRLKLWRDQQPDVQLGRCISIMG